MTAGKWIDVEIGGSDWLGLITASKVAAILGLSPFESPRSLWHKMRGDVPREEQTRAQSRGHYLEPAILAWFFDQHPELLRNEPMDAATFVHGNGWAAASPDALALEAGGEGMFVVEAKSAADVEQWGTPGTDEIPLGYMAQVMWELHVLGMRRAFVPMIGPFLEFTEYVVDYDPTTAAAIEAKCLTFLESLTTDEPPDIDAHPATYESLRKVHPSINDETVDVTDDTATLFLTAIAAKNDAESAFTKARSLIAAELGDARKARWSGSTIATRQASSTGTPFVKAAKNLPTLTGDAA